MCRNLATQSQRGERAARWSVRAMQRDRAAPIPAHSRRRSSRHACRSRRAGRRRESDPDPAPARTIEYGRKGRAKGCLAHNKWQGRTGNRPPLRPFSGKDLQASSAAHHARPRLQIKWERDLSFVLGACRLMSLTPSLATGK